MDTLIQFNILIIVEIMDSLQGEVIVGTATKVEDMVEKESYVQTKVERMKSKIRIVGATSD